MGHCIGNLKQIHGAAFHFGDANGRWPTAASGRTCDILNELLRSPSGVGMSPALFVCRPVAELDENESFALTEDTCDYTWTKDSLPYGGIRRSPLAWHWHPSSTSEAFPGRRLL